MAKVAEELTPEQERFIDENPYVGVVTTLREDGSPHTTVVWVDLEQGGAPSFNTARGRAKPENLERDPRASLLVLDPQDAYKWVSVSGSVELTEEGADEQIDRLAKKYLGKDEYPFRQPGERRVKAIVRAARVDSSGFE